MDMITEQKSRYWILGYPRDTKYEIERKRKKGEHKKEYNTLYKCTKCNKVWEQFAAYKGKKLITYNHMPSYGLNRKDCKKCKGVSNG